MSIVKVPTIIPMQFDFLYLLRIFVESVKCSKNESFEHLTLGTKINKS